MATTTPLGFQIPTGTDAVNLGDNVIGANGAKAEELHQDARGRLTVIEAKNATQDGRLDTVESTNTGQGGRLDAIEAKNTAQDTAITAARAGAVADAKTYTDSTDTTNRAAWAAADTAKLAEAKAYADAGLDLDRTRLTNVEAKQAVKAVRLEAGSWVWDTTAGTHYVIPDHDGALIVRATAQPVPAATPTLNW